ncbi:MAG: hypothetical protein ABIQ01_06895 [Pseudolysinimonas sp.]
MAESGDADVDPRFDPVFQRGYDPQVHGSRRPRSPAGRETSPTPITSRPETTSPRRDAEHPAVARVDAPAAAVAEGSGPAVSAAPDAVSAAPDAVAAADSDLTLQARNPFRLALLIASIASIAGAGLLIWHRIDENPYYQGFSGTDQWMLFRSQLTETALAPLLTGGLLGLCLWLAIGAMGTRVKPDE